MTPAWFFGFGIAAAVFSILQAVDGARRKRAAAIASGAVPPTPAPPAAPVPPVPPVGGPDAEPYREHIVHSILGGWSPFYSFLAAVAMFSLGAITSSQIPKMSTFKMDVVLYAATPVTTAAPAAPVTSASSGPASSPASQSAPAPVPTPKAVTCAGTLSAPAAFTVGGSAIVNYDIDCHGTPVLQPNVTPHIGIATTTATPSTPVSMAVTKDGSSYEWQWVIGAPQGPSSPQPAIESGVDTVLYVTLTPHKDSPKDNIPGTTTPVVIRGRTTFASLTAVVQGLSGFIGAFIALLAGIANFVKKGASPT